MAKYANIKIINQEQYIKRKDLKSIPWVAISSSILEHPDFFDVSGEEFKAFIWILSVSAKCKKDAFLLDINHAVHFTKVSQKNIESCLKKLHGKRLQVLDNTQNDRDTNESVRITNESVPNITEQNGTNEPCDLPHALSDKQISFELVLRIEQIYSSLYPRKEGKSAGVKKLSKELKLDDIPDFENAVKNYRSQVEDQETRFIKHFSSFASCWRDYITIENDKKQSKLKYIL